jgi:hypothetical protein
MLFAGDHKQIHFDFTVNIINGSSISVMIKAKSGEGELKNGTKTNIQTFRE